MASKRNPIIKWQNVPKYLKFYSSLIHQIDTIKVIKMADETFYLQLEKAQSKSLTLVLHSWTDDSSEELKVPFL